MKEKQIKNKMRLFISYCGPDEAIKDTVKVCMLPLIAEFAKKGAMLDICEMSTHCVGEWDKWFISAVKSSDVMIAILTDNVISDTVEKRVLNEITEANSDGLYIIPLIFRAGGVNGLPDQFRAHIHRYSCVEIGLATDKEYIFARLREAYGKTENALSRVMNGDPFMSLSLRIYPDKNRKTREVTLNENFVGREREMLTAVEWLSETNVIIVKGFGGIGKTAFAEQFSLYAKEKIKKVYIIDATGGIESAISNINFEQTSNSPVEERYKNNLELLYKLSEDTLFIFDNCDVEIRPDALKMLLSNENDDCMLCRFIITSRVGARNYKYTIDLDRLDDRELIDLVYKKYPEIEERNHSSRQEIREELLELISYAGGHTLTIEMAAAVMREGDIPIGVIKDRLLDITDECRVRHSDDEYYSVYSRLKALYDFGGLDKVSTDIMRVMALVSPTTGIERSALRNLMGLVDNNDINRLIAKTFLNYDAATNTVGIKELFSDVVFKDSHLENSLDLVERFFKFVTGDINIEGSLKNSSVNKTNYSDILSLSSNVQFVLEKRQEIFDYSPSFEEYRKQLLTCAVVGCVISTDYNKAKLYIDKFNERFSYLTLEDICAFWVTYYSALIENIQGRPLNSVELLDKLIDHLESNVVFADEVFQRNMIGMLHRTAYTLCSVSGDFAGVARHSVFAGIILETNKTFLNDEKYSALLDEKTRKNLENETEYLAGLKDMLDEGKEYFNQLSALTDNSYDEEQYSDTDELFGDDGGDGVNGFQGWAEKLSQSGLEHDLSLVKSQEEQLEEAFTEEAALRLATTYHGIAQKYYLNEDFKQALLFYQKALEIFRMDGMQKYDVPIKAECYYGIGLSIIINGISEMSEKIEELDDVEEDYLEKWIMDLSDKANEYFALGDEYYFGIGNYSAVAMYHYTIMILKKELQFEAKHILNECDFVFKCLEKCDEAPNNLGVKKETAETALETSLDDKQYMKACGYLVKFAETAAVNVEEAFEYFSDEVSYEDDELNIYLNLLNIIHASDKSGTAGLLTLMVLCENKIGELYYEDEQFEQALSHYTAVLTAVKEHPDELGEFADGDVFGDLLCAVYGLYMENVEDFSGFALFVAEWGDKLSEYLNVPDDDGDDSESDEDDK